MPMEDNMTQVCEHVDEIRPIALRGFDLEHCLDLWLVSRRWNRHLRERG
jgi:hypothetical protein